MTRIFNEIIVRPFKVFVFTGASFLKNYKIDPRAVQQSKDSLQEKVGGETLALRTPDGDILDGMYLDAKTFKKSCDQYLEKIETIDYEGNVVELLIIKKSLCNPRIVNGKGQLSPTLEAIHFFDFATKSLGLPSLEKEGQITNESNVATLKYKAIVLPKFNDQNALTGTNFADKSNPTALICPGSTTSYPFYKKLAASYLIRGINVMMVDYRGYGTSEGSPTTHKLNLDMETAYQYLKEKKGVADTDLVVHGHCLGAGPAANLASRRPGINLVLDRTFNEYSEAARQLYPKIGKIVSKALPWIVDYNNGQNLAKTTGHIAIIRAKNDTMITKEQVKAQRNHLPHSETGKQGKYIKAKVEHGGFLGEDLLALEAFDQFLEKAHLRRRL